MLNILAQNMSIYNKLFAINSSLRYNYYGEVRWQRKRNQKKMKQKK